MRDLALLILRLTVGGLMAGHGAQKLFGWFGGYGIQGTAGWLESMNMRPGRAWAMLAGGSEFGGGMLTALGFLNPLGPLGIIGSMVMATVKVHWGNPIWVSANGAELPVTNMAAASALILTGPGRLSIDGLTGFHLPRWLVIPGLVGIAAATVIGTATSQATPEAQEEVAGEELQGQQDRTPEPVA